MRKATTTIAMIALSLHALPQAGTLDATFGNGGKISDLHPNAEAKGVVVQPDGKIVVGGYITSGGDRDIMLLRYDADGNPDLGFYANGTVITNIDTSGNAQDFNNSASAIALQPDGKIIAAGNTHNGTDLDIALVRYNGDGNIDSTFGDTGVVQTGISGNDVCNAIVLQPDGKIIVGGTANNFADVVLVRYDVNGGLDPAFGSGGIAITDLGNANETIFSLALQADGKVIAGGVTYNTPEFDMAIMRYNTDGSLDSTFNQTGMVIQSLSSDDDRCLSVAVTPAGKILAVGSVDQESAFAIVQLNDDGTPDNSFGVAGVHLTVFSTLFNGAAAIVVQPDGKILAGGFTNTSTTEEDFALIRCDAYGDLDPAFDVDGKVTTDFNTDWDEINALALQPDGKIVAAGFRHAAPFPTFALARYNNDLSTGTAAITNHGDGIMIYPNPSAGDLTVEWKGGRTALLRVHDVLGAIVMEQRATSPARLSVPAKGIYFLGITDGDNNVLNRKVVIK